MNSVWRLPLVGLVFLLAACQPQQATAPPPPPQVTVSQPVARDVIEWDEYSGQLEAVESVEVRARVSGYLQSVHFTAGTVVKKGALLFVIDPRPYQAELDRAKAALEQAMARFERTQKDFARAQQLVRSRAISQEEVDTRSADQREAQEAARAARAAVEAARLNLALVPGLFARTRLPGSGRYAALLLPDQAIGSDQTQRFVLVVNDQHTVEYRKVEVGPMIDGLRVIRDGLKPEEWVIVNGVQRVRPGAKLDAQQQVGPKDQARPRAGEGAPRQTGGCCARRIDSPQSPPVWRASLALRSSRVQH